MVVGDISTGTDLLVVGAGPGGYVAAIRAGQLDLDVTLVDDDGWGGTCLNYGCIPSKALITATDLAEEAGNAAEMGVHADPEVDMAAMVDWKDGVVDQLTSGVEKLCKANGVNLVQGRAEFAGENEARIVHGGEGQGAETVEFERAVIATGSRPIQIPGFDFGDRPVLDSRQALALDSVPDRLVVVGAGYVGMELSTVFAKAGADVTVVEMLDGILPGYAEDLARPVRTRAEQLGIDFHFGTTAREWYEHGDGIRVVTEPADAGGGPAAEADGGTAEEADGGTAEEADGSPPGEVDGDTAEEGDGSTAEGADGAATGETEGGATEAADDGGAEVLDDGGAEAADDGGTEEVDAGAASDASEPTGDVREFDADRVLVAVGRRPVTDTLNLDALGLEPDERGFLPTDDRARTDLGHVFAIGDVAGEPMLAHKASYEGKVAAEVAAGEPAAVDYQAVPAAVFTDPEIGTVGMTEAEAAEAGFEPAVGEFPFRASGRALTTGHDEGFVRVVADGETGFVLGGQVVGPEASELIAELGLAIEMGATLEDVAATIHAHPTLAEAVMEACENALGRAIHTLNR